MRLGFGTLILFAISAAESEECQSSSHVIRHTFVSSVNPPIRVTVNKKFSYIGSFPFEIGDSVAGSRYIFVVASREKHIQRMFIIQQEGFLPSSNDTYKYSITNSVALGGSEYQHSVIFDDNAARIREEPGKEADDTQRFLTAHGFLLEPELIMSRYARPADPQRKHEIIFFCYENLSSYRHKLVDFHEGRDSPEQREIKQKMDENCRNSFRVR